MPHLIRVVEDDDAVRASLVALLESWDFSVASYPDGESLLADPEAGKAQAILLDLRLPALDGISVLTELRARGIDVPVVILTGHGNVETAVTALREGAQDFIEKPFSDNDLVRRIDGAIAQAQASASAAYAQAFSTLTPRETEVMLGVVAGDPNKVIAHELGLSPKTVEIHRARVMEKTGAKSLSQLVRMAIKAGIDPDA